MEVYYCPFIAISEFQGNACMKEKCMFWDGELDMMLPKWNCVLTRAAMALSTHER